MSDGNETTPKACLATLAIQKLQSHGALHDSCKSVQIEFDGSKLILTGHLPTFYLKQQAQEVLRELRVPIYNRIRVSQCE